MPKKKKRTKEEPLRRYKFNLHSSLLQKEDFDKNALPIVFKVTPDTLLNLCIKIVDGLPLPSVYKWTNMEVCKWIRKYGYPQYMNTFRVNLITGQKLLLLDAQSLSAMNIKNFSDMKHIAYGIRQLFFYEMTKYARSISLPPEYYYELYKLFMVKSGPKYEVVRRSDLWRRMQLLREKSAINSHWDLLERWLARMLGQSELFGGVHRYRLYKCKPQPPPQPHKMAFPTPCRCMPPCSCYWTERHLAAPAVFKILQTDRKPSKCDLIECRRGLYKFDMRLTCLKTNFPGKYAKDMDEVVKKRPIFACLKKVSIDLAD
ncbi:uncharacterized protein LOC118738163 [Rhagoletis pomonella]|uniref:uncharacterized protein LOC118738163 n=1 Tax=Rhagoletis pomonella TaxID=28610 RepID=UPI00177FE855|nr:uncharacterized protein LOC118738163 [Rhagoletis pomonella]